jgi:Protein of unknown function (DUF1232)
MNKINVRKAGAVILLSICVVYILNPTAGIFEILPDNIPIFGNIDEGLATYLLLCSINYLHSGKFPIFSRFIKT